MRVAIMQPAFIPPASYFRLFAATDVFVIYDNVQFNRRWYTHRQKLTNRNGEKEWLTLPLMKQPRDGTKICHIHWTDNVKEEWRNRLLRFPVFDESSEFIDEVRCLYGYALPSIFLEMNLYRIKLLLGLSDPTIVSKHNDWYKSSMFDIPDDLRGQDRIIALCKKIGATEYVNSPGGKDLYTEKIFLDNGIKLTFLPEWVGPNDSIIERLANENPMDIRKKIYDQI